MSVAAVHFIAVIQQRMVLLLLINCLLINWRDWSILIMLLSLYFAHHKTKYVSSVLRRRHVNTYKKTR